MHRQAPQDKLQDTKPLQTKLVLKLAVKGNTRKLFIGESFYTGGKNVKIY